MARSAFHSSQGTRVSPAGVLGVWNTPGRGQKFVTSSSAFLVSFRAVRVLYLACKYYLAACGAVMLLTLFFDRSPWLGVAQLVIIGTGVRDEISERWATGRW